MHVVEGAGHGALCVSCHHRYNSIADGGCNKNTIRLGGLGPPQAMLAASTSGDVVAGPAPQIVTRERPAALAADRNDNPGPYPGAARNLLPSCARQVSGKRPLVSSLGVILAQRFRSEHTAVGSRFVFGGHRLQVIFL